MPAPRSKFSRRIRGRVCAPRGTRRRSTRWAAWSPVWLDACLSAAKSLATPVGSNLRCSTQIREGLSGCASAACRPPPPSEALPVPDAWYFRLQPGSRVATPLCRVAQELAALSGWRRYGLAFLFGVAAAAALPPVDLAPLLLVAFPGLLWLDDGSAGPGPSFGLGYAFGFGFFLAGLYWIAGALFVDIAAFWWLVPAAAIGLP